MDINGQLCRKQIITKQLKEVKQNSPSQQSPLKQMFNSSCSRCAFYNCLTDKLPFSQQQIVSRIYALSSKETISRAKFRRNGAAQISRLESKKGCHKNQLEQNIRMKCCEYPNVSVYRREKSLKSMRKKAFSSQFWYARQKTALILFIALFIIIASSSFLLTFAKEKREDRQLYNDKNAILNSHLDRSKNNENKLINKEGVIQEKRRLSQHILHYEPLNYDHHEVHRRTKRDLENSYLSSGHPIRLDFQAHGHKFNLRLKPDADSVFAYDATIENGNGESVRHLVNMDTALLSGHLQDDTDNSLVYGSLHRGIFEGKIQTKSGKSFYVERVQKYLQDLPKHDQSMSHARQLSDLDFHSVIYASDDVLHPHLSSHSHAPELQSLNSAAKDQLNSSKINSSLRHDNHDGHNHDNYEMIGGTCGHLDDSVKKWMESVANSAIPGSEEETEDQKKRHLQQKDLQFQDDMIHRMQDYYGYGIVETRKNSSGFSERNFQTTRGIWSASKNKNLTRNKRQTFGGGDSGLDFSQVFSPKPRVSHTIPAIDYPLKRRACSLYIQTDTYLWNHTRKNNANDRDTREEIASLVAQHIKAVNHIYENSDFGGVRGLKFIVQRLRINDTQACDAVRRPTNPFCLPNIDVSNFLNLNSQFNHNDFCLAYIFTYRDFSGGTLGLAWVASTSGASGGICEKYKVYNENVHGRQVQAKRSLNTGIITFVNYNSRVPPKVSELTLAHEIGHNFGSPHDYPADCRPGGPQGNYIMYSSATSGERGNNNKFSPCSIRNISSVLHAIFSVEGKENCFQEDDGPFCGNKIVEEGEECDCGYDSRECTETCCYPREQSSSFTSQSSSAAALISGPDFERGPPCKRRREVQCSPSEGPCCSEECSFVGREKICRQETECSMSQSCDFRQAMCPESLAKPNLTECNGGTQVCWNGQCTGSICQKYGLEECFLTAKSGAKPEEMCEVACQVLDQPGSCKRTSDLPAMQHISGLKLRPGSPCNDFQGYCDVFQRCRPVDAEGPLARLKNTLLNQKTLMTIKQWTTTYWWACMLMLIAFIMLMAAFIKCCAVHTPTSNPKKRPALRITDTLRRPADKLRRKKSSHVQSNGHSRIHSSRGGHSSWLVGARPGQAYAADPSGISRGGQSAAASSSTSRIDAVPNSSGAGRRSYHHSGNTSADQIGRGGRQNGVHPIHTKPPPSMVVQESISIALQHKPVLASPPQLLVGPTTSKQQQPPLPNDNPPPYDSRMQANPIDKNQPIRSVLPTTPPIPPSSTRLSAPSSVAASSNPQQPAQTAMNQKSSSSAALNGLPLMAKHGWHRRNQQSGKRKK